MTMVLKRSCLSICTSGFRVWGTLFITTEDYKTKMHNKFSAGRMTAARNRTSHNHRN